MSGDPERLLSAGSPTDRLERELLSSVRDVGPPGGARERVWSGIAAQLAVVAAVGTASGGAAAAGGKGGVGALSAWALSTKAVVAVAASGLALGGGYLLQTEPSAPRSASSASGAAQSSSAPPPAARPSARAPTPTPTPTPTPARDATTEATVAPHRREPRQDLLAAESALLAEARARLRSGNAASAQAVLERMQAQFPKGTLSQEREVVAIEVLRARGDAAGAARRARAFMKAYPKSPHSPKLARFTE